ncbi:hypothetical protein [Sporichthya sp.]|uniref:hypothetical protein n=1 Tax=Sporichthya sp. TaxID=65475 RepID=UPI0025F1C286|nr:hypothetical protein [Sporichthya sp.]
MADGASVARHVRVGSANDDLRALLGDARSVALADDGTLHVHGLEIEVIGDLAA